MSPGGQQNAPNTGRRGNFGPWEALTQGWPPAHGRESSSLGKGQQLGGLGPSWPPSQEQVHSGAMVISKREVRSRCLYTFPHPDALHGGLTYSADPEHLFPQPLLPTWLAHLFHSAFYISTFISGLLLFNKA